MSRGARIGVALAGGGPLGAVYEIGALCALEEALSGIAFADLDAYLGVSAGGFIAAGLANGITPRELCASFIENEGPAHDVFPPSVLLRPAWGEFGRRLARLPGLAGEAAVRDLLGRRSWSSALERLGRALPAGVLSNAGIDAQLRSQFERPGRSNDFRQLARRLVLVATDLDSGEAAPFGLPGWDHVPISTAVQASAALPGLFPPVEIDGRSYVDGALRKTLHASVLLDEGVGLLLCLNPLVPFEASPHGSRRIPRLAEGGLPVVMSQTLRSLIHSRLQLGMAQYARTHPHADIVLFEPEGHDVEIFDANTFSYRQRRRLAEHAYQQTRRLLRRRAATLAPRLRRHGIALRHDVLARQDLTLLPRKAPDAPRWSRAVGRLDAALDGLAAALEALAGAAGASAPGVGTVPGNAHSSAPVIAR